MSDFGELTQSMRDYGIEYVLDIALDMLDELPRAHQRKLMIGVVGAAAKVSLEASLSAADKPADAGDTLPLTRSE
jgi:hypothetical protein